MIDSSGLRFYYTKHLRKYDAGVLQVGAFVDYSLMIPPKETSWEINGFCSEECTREVCSFKKLLAVEGFFTNVHGVSVLFSILVTMNSRGLSSLSKQNKIVERRSFRFRNWTQHCFSEVYLVRFFKSNSTWLLQICFVNKLKAKNNEQIVVGLLHPLGLISLQVQCY